MVGLKAKAGVAFRFEVSGPHHPKADLAAINESKELRLLFVLFVLVLNHLRLCKWGV